MQEWFLLSLFAAIWSSVYTALIKKATAQISPIVFLLVGSLVGLPSTLGLIIISGGLPQFSSNFWLFVSISAILDAIGFYLLTRAIQKTDVSLVAPISSFTPVFVTIFASFGLREFPSPIKLLGILTVVVGTYLLNVSEIKKGFFEPFKKLFGHEELKMVFVAYLIWGITPIFQKSAILQTSPQNPLAVAFLSSFIFTLIYIPFGIKSIKKESQSIVKIWPIFLILALVTGLGTYTSFKPFQLTNVAYPSAVFKLSALFTIIGGGLFFKERNLGERLIGAVVMIIGTVLLII